MLSPTRSLSARLSPVNCSSIVLLDFLVPAFISNNPTRPFSASSRPQSRIGAAPLSIPPTVQVRFKDEAPSKPGLAARRVEPPRTLEVEGPLGKLSIEVPAYMSFSQDMETRKGMLQVRDKQVRKQREMWGTTRATINNLILGVSEGHTAILRLNGVGYRATVESSAITKQPEYPGQKFVSLKVGYSHPIELGVPQGVNASTPQPTRILLEGPDKIVVRQFAAEIREWRKPEPYKGKGIFVDDETIKLKAKKIK